MIYVISKGCHGEVDPYGVARSLEGAKQALKEIVEDYGLDQAIAMYGPEKFVDPKVQIDEWDGTERLEIDSGYEDDSVDLFISVEPFGCFIEDEPKGGPDVGG